MLGFNKILQIQPSRQPQSSRTPMKTLSNNEYRGNQQGQTLERRQHQATPIKRPAVNEDGPPVNRSRTEFITPVRRPFLDNQEIQNAPLKKRPTEMVLAAGEPRKSRDVSEVLLEDDDDVYSQSLIDDDMFPANQQGLYDGGFGESNSQPRNESASTSTAASSSASKGKVGFERVNEETVEMGGFILPGSEKKSIHKSYNWIAGRADGQYRVVLGYNTLFKVKNAVDSSTGEKDCNRWRVVRFENRYKENYPYTEFPAKYLEPLIQALEKAREQHAIELKEDSVLEK